MTNSLDSSWPFVVTQPVLKPFQLYRFTECDVVGGGVLDDEVFGLAWSPTLVALSYLLDKVVDDSLLTQKLMTGYRKCATIAAHYGRTEVFDHLIQALYKYTGQYSLPFFTHLDHQTPSPQNSGD